MSNNTPRLVDKETSSRSIPMKVLVLGMCRTGTSSIYVALNKLGYRTYHMLEAVKDGRRAFPLWKEAFDAKFTGVCKPWEKRDFDVLLGDYDAVADIPCAVFIEELIAAYPDVKVILTNRDVDSWLVSMHKTVFRVMAWPSWPYLAPFDPIIRVWYPCLGTILEYFCRNDYSIPNGAARSAYIEHYEHVRRVVPKERLLEFGPNGSWTPLCDFLGKDKPDGDYPRINESEDFVKIHERMWNHALKEAVTKTSLAVVTVTVVAMLLRRRGLLARSPV